MERVTAAAVQTAAGGIEVEDVRAALVECGAADLVVFPELCHLPYFPLERNDRWKELATGTDSGFVAAVRAMVAERRCYAVLPAYVVDDGSAYNAAMLIDPEGKLVTGRGVMGREMSVYHKVHLCDQQFYGAAFEESRYFTPGECLVVWDAQFATIGILICYDRHFPEAWRTMRALGADIVCVPVASPSGTRPTFIAELQAMALQQGLFVVAANRVGQETLQASNTTTTFLGHSCVIAPDGVVLAAAMSSEPEVVLADLDPRQLDRARAGMPLVEDRRPDTYRLD